MSITNEAQLRIVDSSAGIRANMTDEQLAYSNDNDTTRHIKKGNAINRVADTFYVGATSAEIDATSGVATLKTIKAADGVENDDVATVNNIKVYAEPLIQDSGWIALGDIKPDWSTTGAGSYSYRKVGSLVTIEFCLTGGTYTRGVSLMTLPEEIRPAGSSRGLSFIGSANGTVSNSKTAVKFAFLNNGEVAAYHMDPNNEPTEYFTFTGSYYVEESL